MSDKKTYNLADVIEMHDVMFRSENWQYGRLARVIQPTTENPDGQIQRCDIGYGLWEPYAMTKEDITARYEVYQFSMKIKGA